MAIPTQLEHPNGLHQKYVIKELVPMVYAKGTLLETNYIAEVSADPYAEYFVLRLDEKAVDKEHLKACRIAINSYADAIQHHLPELTKDLKERYPLL